MLNFGKAPPTPSMKRDSFDDSNDNESAISAESIDRMYEDGLDMNQFNFSRIYSN